MAYCTVKVLLLMSLRLKIFFTTQDKDANHARVKLDLCSSSSQVIVAHMSMFANNALLGGGVRVRVWIREQRKIKRRSKALLSL